MAYANVLIRPEALGFGWCVNDPMCGHLGEYGDWERVEPGARVRGQLPAG